ncbi:hypothetical protein LWI29_000474 [Acer saccharum]|uniref:Uncharacterized protein n=1 Tax=Acer saccharum TaxID=4024 RepID=A0AA39SQ86_ACESA|nr:hypothetical protein LWI29_000474 [Acer saccharum]
MGPAGEEEQENTVMLNDIARLPYSIKNFGGILDSTSEDKREPDQKLWYSQVTIYQNPSLFMTFQGCQELIKQQPILFFCVCFNDFIYIFSMCSTISIPLNGPQMMMVMMISLWMIGCQDKPGYAEELLERFNLIGGFKCGVLRDHVTTFSALTQPQVVRCYI